MSLKKGRFVLGTFCSERMRVLYQSRPNDRLRVMLVLVHIDIKPPHPPEMHSAKHSPVLAPNLRYFKVFGSGILLCSRHARLVKCMVTLLAKEEY
ncbi:hypothetical protein TNCV_2508871 [Trichonephila clavipes]|nr:hypothetical protein TNCV_2508871 [Trichonephila clavipes]